MMIHWCELCNNAPAEGILEVIRKETLETDFMQCCSKCVDKLAKEDWL